MCVSDNVWLLPLSLPRTGVRAKHCWICNSLVSCSGKLSIKAINHAAAQRCAHKSRTYKVTKPSKLLKSENYFGMMCHTYDIESSALLAQDSISLFSIRQYHCPSTLYLILFVMLSLIPIYKPIRTKLGQKLVKVWNLRFGIHDFIGWKLKKVVMVQIYCFDPISLLFQASGCVNAYCF